MRKNFRLVKANITDSVICFMPVFGCLGFGYFCAHKIVIYKKMQEKSSAWLQQTLLKLDLGKEADYQRKVSELLEEQPYLMGFVFNLAEDFTEETHELIIRAILALQESLAHAGLFFKVITTQQLEEVLDDKIKAFETLENEGPESFTEENIIDKASSPIALNSLYKFVDENANEFELPFEHRTSLLLVLSAIIELFEIAASPENPEKAMPTDA